jgi:predicted thioesterase
LKIPFAPGDQKTFERIIQTQDTATFDSGQVHPVYATFALARDIEWACRLFVLEMKEADEEGIGTSLAIQHLSPALVGETVSITATVKSIQKNEIICSYEARVEDRLIATGEQGQKILKKERIEGIFNNLRQR